jgi:superfamily II DNA or RNA helicase
VFPDGTGTSSDNRTYGYLSGSRAGTLLKKVRRCLTLFSIGTTSASGLIACRRRMQPSRMHDVMLGILRHEGPARRLRMSRASKPLNRAPGELQLRPYQAEAIAAAKRAYERGIKSALISLPTGAGKTVVFASLARDFLPERTLVLAHREELLAQAKSKIAGIAGVMPGLEKGRTRSSVQESVVVASVQSLMRGRKIAGKRFGLCVIDEAHHAAAPSYRAVLKRLKPRCILGVTATPFRTDQLQLSKVFEKNVYTKTLLDLIGEGYLTDIRVRTLPVAVNLSGVRVQQGDYREDDLGRALEPAFEKLADIVAAEFRNRKLVAFCPLRETSRQWTAALRRRNLPAAHVDGESTGRAKILSAFAGNEIRFLSNASLLTEGYDEPSIDAVLILRPTKSGILFSQMIGRGTRLFPGKDHLLVIDPLFQAERNNNPVTVANLVAENSYQPSAIDTVMRQGRIKLSKAVAIGEQGVRPQALIKAFSLVEGREGYEAAFSDLCAANASLPVKSGLPAALKDFARSVKRWFWKGWNRNGAAGPSKLAKRRGGA